MRYPKDELIAGLIGLAVVGGTIGGMIAMNPNPPAAITYALIMEERGTGLGNQWALDTGLSVDDCAAVIQEFPDGDGVRFTCEQEPSPS